MSERGSDTGRYVRRKPPTKPGAGRKSGNVATTKSKVAGRKTPENPGLRDVATSAEAGRKTPENHEPLDWSRPFVQLYPDQSNIGQLYNATGARVALLLDNACSFGYPMPIHVCERHPYGKYNRRCAECRLCACRQCQQSTMERAAANAESLDARIPQDQCICMALLSTNHVMCNFCGRSDNFLCVGDGRSICASCCLEAQVDNELVCLTHASTCDHSRSQSDYAEGNLGYPTDEFGLPKARDDYEDLDANHEIDITVDFADAPVPSAPAPPEIDVLVDMEGHGDACVPIANRFSPIVDFIDFREQHEQEFLVQPRVYVPPCLRTPYSIEFHDTERYFAGCLSWLFTESDVNRPPKMPSKPKHCNCWYCSGRWTPITPVSVSDARKSLRRVRSFDPALWSARIDYVAIEEHNSKPVFTTVPTPVTEYFRRAWFGDPARQRVVIGHSGLASMFEGHDPSRRIGRNWTSVVNPVRNPGMQQDLYRRALFMTREMAHRKAVSENYVRSLPDPEEYRPELEVAATTEEDSSGAAAPSKDEKVVKNVAVALSRDNNVVSTDMVVLPWNRHVTDPLYRPYVSDEQMPEHTYAAVLTRTVGMPIDQTSLKAVANFSRNFIKSNYSWLTEPQVLKIMTIVQYKWQAQVSPIDNTVHHFAKKHTAAQVEHISKTRTGAVLRSRFFGLWKSYEQVIPKST